MYVLTLGPFSIAGKRAILFKPTEQEIVKNQSYVSSKLHMAIPLCLAGMIETVMLLSLTEVFNMTSQSYPDIPIGPRIKHILYTALCYVSSTIF